MSEKVILILVDGMRPDGLLQCGHPFVNELLENGTSYLAAQTVMPSVTLPCHMSLFHSVDPDRHGITSNTHTPQVRPIEGLIDRLDSRGKKCASIYNWEELRDLSRPGHLHFSYFLNEEKDVDTDTRITDTAVQYIEAEQPDFLFLYLGETDTTGGHDSGWMSETYLQVVNNAIACTKRVCDCLPDGYTLILTADHGGHGRGHGSDMPEDMTIPILCLGSRFEKGLQLPGGSIKDIAVTIARLMDIDPAKEWEGSVLQMLDANA
ncbi:MAG: alkaline phosphatase family protein [Clostridia bacterium]|nr:alkaline phosphatase family protein [Clostridia bacterium]